MNETESPILEHIERAVRTHPGAPAVTDHAGTVTYGHLWQEVSACAEFLAPYGGRDVPVGVCLPNGAAFVTALLGTARVGGAGILLPTGLGSAELRACCREAGVRTILSTADHRALVEAGGGRPARRGPRGLELFTFDGPAGSDTRPGDFIAQLTSGVDYPSKMAVRTHAAVWTEVEGVAEAIDLTARDATLVLSALSHSYGLIGGTLAPLCRGARVILGDRRFPEAVLRTARRERPTILFAVPVTYAALAGEPGTQGDLSSVRLSLSAGAPLPRHVGERFVGRYGRRVSQDYGTTEMGTVSLRLEGTAGTAGSVGRPLPHAAVTIVDSDGRAVPPGCRGEIVVRSPALARRYLGMVPAATGLADDYLSTGDLGWLEDGGHLFLGGRMSSLIHVGGAAIDPVEVEAVISRLPGVREVAVVGVPGAPSAERLKAVVVAEGVTAAGIRQHCRAHLGGRRVPEIIEFRDAIPRTPAGKILRRVLRADGDRLR